MKNLSKVTFLGTGTSQGVPVIACSCEVCLSENISDKRLRSSVMLTSTDGKNIVIDTGPDFRQQMLANNVQNLEAVVYTHEHKDHIAGMDDIRAFNFIQQRHMDLYCNSDVVEALNREFPYVFAEYKYPGVPEVRINDIKEGSRFTVANMGFNAIEVMHYKLPVLAFRVDDFAYVTDANFISEENKKKLRGLDVLVLNALRREKHISHFTLDEAIALVNELKPKHTYLTHISHQLGTHDDVTQELPSHISLASDGLQISL
ncbi:MAG: phosphoribosyl 1,2-cyclic phosphate phosphodiesterase [Flavobacteriales bacterium]